MKIKDVVKEAVLKQIKPGVSAQIQDPEKGITYDIDLSKPEMAAALRPGEQGGLEFDPTPELGGAQQGGTGNTGPQPGQEVSIKADEVVGGDPTDDFIDDVEDKDYSVSEGNDLGTVPTTDFVKGVYELAASFGSDAPNPDEVKKLIVLAPNGEVDVELTFKKIIAAFQSQLPEIQQLMKELDELVKKEEASSQASEIGESKELDRWLTIAGLR